MPSRPRTLFILLLLFTVTKLLPASSPDARGKDPGKEVELALDAYKNNAFARAKEHFHQAIPALVSSEDYTTLGMVYYRLACIAKKNSEITQTILLLNTSVNYLERAGGGPLLIDALNLLGVTYNDLGMADRSLEVQLRALRLAEAAHNNLAAAIMLVNISGAWGTGERALSSLNRAIRLLDNVRDDTARGYVYNAFGMLYDKRNRFDSSLYYYNLSLEYKIRVKHYQGIAFTYDNIGGVYQKQGRMGEARVQYNEALRIARSINDALSLCVTYGSLAGYYRLTGDERKWMEATLEQVRLAKQLGFKEEEAAGLLALSDYFQRNGDPRVALGYLQQYTRLRDSLTMANSQRAMAEAMVRYELAEKEKQLVCLKSENELKSARIQRNRIIIFSMIAFLLTLLTAFWYLFRLYREKMLAYKELVRKDMEALAAETAPQTEANAAAPPAPSVKIKNMSPAVLCDEMQERLNQGLLQAMETQKRYLDPQLTLAELAHELQTNTSYLSRIINERFEKNFNQFLNEYRIREARRLLISPDHENLSIEGIARSAGFNSKSAFNTAFKTATGVTPSIYQKSARKIRVPELPGIRLPHQHEGQNYP